MNSIVLILLNVVYFAGVIWFWWLWPRRLNRALIKNSPNTKSFLFGFFLSSYALSIGASTPLFLLFLSFTQEGAALPSQIMWIILLVFPLVGLLGYGLLKRRRIVWGGYIAINWLWAIFVAYMAREIAVFGSIVAILFSAALLIPLTIYIKRRWHELR